MCLGVGAIVSMDMCEVCGGVSLKVTGPGS